MCDVSAKQTSEAHNMGEIACFQLVIYVCTTLYLCMFVLKMLECCRIHPTYVYETSYVL